MRKIKFIILSAILVFAQNNYAQQLEIELSLQPLYDLDEHTFYSTFVYPLEWETVEKEYFFPNDSFNFGKIMEHYTFQEQEIITHFSDTIVDKIIPGEYQYWLDTIKVDIADTSNFRIEVDTPEFSNTIFYYLVLRPTLKTPIQHHQNDFCCDYINAGKFTTWSLHKTLPARVLYRSYSLKDKTNTFHLKDTRTYTIENLKIIQLPKVIYKIIPEQRKTIMTLIPKSENAPKHYIKPIKYNVKKLSKEAGQLNRGGWYEYKTKCSCKEMPFMTFEDLSILRLQYALNQMGYDVKQTNMIDNELIGLLARLDLEKLHNIDLMMTANLILKVGF